MLHNKIRIFADIHIAIHFNWIAFFVFYIIILNSLRSIDVDIFCKIVSGEIPTKKIFEDDTVMVIMDVNSVSDGHCLVIPKRLI